MKVVKKAKQQTTKLFWCGRLVKGVTFGTVKPLAFSGCESFLDCVVSVIRCEHPTMKLCCIVHILPCYEANKDTHRAICDVTFC